MSKFLSDSDSITEFKRLSLKWVPILGLAFASTQLTWALFNIAIPIYLKETFGIPLALVGFIMTWDNIIAFFVQPYIGTRSDKTRTKFGRRLPYIIPGMVFGAIFFFLIPYASSINLFVFLATIVIFNLSMALYRSPSVSLMPDMIASEQHSAGNGIVNLMGGVFAGASLFIAGGMLKDGNATGAFAFVSIGVVISLVVILLLVREPEYPELTEEEKSESAFSKLSTEIKRLVSEKDKSYLFMLLAILSWFVAWNAIEAFYSIYVANIFLPEMDALDAAGVAGQVQSIFPIIFVVFTIVGGFLGSVLGRIKTMKIGLLFFLIAIITGAFVQPESLFGIAIGWQTSFRLIFVVAGAAWGLVNVNSIVVVWHHATDNGTGSGVYYAFASTAAIAGPTLAGIFMDVDVHFLFPFSISFLVLALIFLFLVKTGEVGDVTGDVMAEMID